MLDKTYDAAAVEPRIANLWNDAGAFRAGAGAREGADPFTIVIPPPNVTGSLHMGHALNNTLQDVLVRFERMRGRDVLWQPGTDHAGIATQMVVERQLAERQEPDRRAMGREAFVDRIWTWKAESGGTIQNQLFRLGASCDWSRERFTMDDGLSAAVLEVFVKLHEEGLIYRDKRLVNWDPRFLTAISDLEVQQIEVKGKLWHFRYPIEGGATYQAPVAFDEETGEPTEFETRDYIVVATTRPETMLGDTAVAVHPEDPRYKDLIGRHVVLPLVGRRIPIVADDYADPETGSGAVKITPAHDFNDFEVGRRNDLRMINILDEEAKLFLADNDAFLEGLAADPDFTNVMALNGADRFKARDAIVELMEARELLDRIEDHVHMVPHGDRSGVVIEPFLTDQWYVDAATLAKPAMEAVRKGDTTFVPGNWERVYFEWMENIQPWCVSRQLWWGHQIPAWYGPDGATFVAKTEAEALAAAEARFGKPIALMAKQEAVAAWETGGDTVALYRDEDVLDTWFSSALWPFSTLGWPDQTPELARYYPTSVLVTGFDIIFFWVARMMMMGLHFTDQAPFHTVYIHALVRDEKGAKMSKSKGNVIDPIDLIDQFGADALRFTLSAMAAQGRDIKLSPARVQGYRNFTTKLWNAARFAEMNGCRPVADFDPSTAKETLSQWILVETARTGAAVTEAIEAYRFNDAAGAVYSFTWHTFCDWFLELAKPTLQGEDGPAKTELQAVTAWVIDEIVKLLHPFMPFLTEELWARTAEEAGISRPALLALTAWPDLKVADNPAAREINWLVALITQIRSVRSETNVPAGAQIPVVLVGAGETERGWIATHEAAIKRLARVETIEEADAPPPQSAQVILGDVTVCLPLAGVVDIDAERARLKKELDRLAGEIKKIDGKLSNPSFVERAPEEVVEEQRERREEAESRRVKVSEALGRL
ncbi:valine--tRNA ligase [Amorphus orientalis]|uniref:Valine--tRNA ligase n=1 Tax=Amorphus orientalis TaxID=649198 RepID=A0AAE3VQP3_9HYPH|nr:valine--tRNA ligase [Amorphus orientalis]MDQ0316430.1 valyl-tRNA synthetase [Amorphus orientalis]